MLENHYFGSLQPEDVAFGFMVYPKDVYIKIVVVVNADTFLWITTHFGLESGVYELYKKAGKPCMSTELFWDKKRRPKICFVYSHSVPVDIHTVIHSCKRPFCENSDEIGIHLSASHHSGTYGWR
jgi:hypothetical protein